MSDSLGSSTMLVSSFLSDLRAKYGDGYTHYVRLNLSDCYNKIGLMFDNPVFKNVPLRVLVESSLKIDDFYSKESASMVPRGYDPYARRMMDAMEYAMSDTYSLLELWLWYIGQVALEEANYPDKVFHGLSASLSIMTVDGTWYTFDLFLPLNLGQLSASYVAGVLCRTFTNPSVILAESVKAGSYDAVSDVVFNAVSECVNRRSLLYFCGNQQVGLAKLASFVAMNFVRSAVDVIKNGSKPWVMEDGMPVYVTEDVAFLADADGNEIQDVSDLSRADKMDASGEDRGDWPEFV